MPSTKRRADEPSVAAGSCSARSGAPTVAAGPAGHQELGRAGLEGRSPGVTAFDIAVSACRTQGITSSHALPLGASIRSCIRLSRRSGLSRPLRTPPHRPDIGPGHSNSAPGPDPETNPSAASGPGRSHRNNERSEDPWSTKLPIRHTLEVADPRPDTLCGVSAVSGALRGPQRSKLQTAAEPLLRFFR